MPDSGVQSIVTLVAPERRAGLSQALHQAGYAVLESGDAAAALHHLVSQPALALFESGLPDLLEADFVRALRAAPGAGALAIVQITAHPAHVETRIRALEDGVDTYLTQADLPEIIAHVDALLRRSGAMKAQLRKSESRFALVEKGTELGVWFCDLPFDRLHWNDHVKKHFFLTPEDEVTIDTFYARIHPEDRDPTREAIQRAIETGGLYDTVFRTCAPEGEQLHSIRALGRTFYDKNHVAIHFDGITIDMSEHKQAEEAIRQANRRKDEFLANMSHEIRTPMNAVVGLTHILGMSEPLTAKQRECIRTLQTSSQSLLALINDLLDIAKIESDEVHFETVPFSMRSVAEDAVRVLSVRAGEKDIGLRLEYPPGMPEQFVGDPLRVKQIVTNLLSNAVKFTERGGVVLRFSRMPVEIPEEAGPESETHAGLRIEVSDTGIGIPADKQTIIFNKFSQGDGSITRKYGGTGLGLAITHSIVERLEGTISVASAEGQGSTFVVHLPLLPVEMGKPREDAPALGAPGKLRGMPRILLVEDYPPNVLVATCLLDSLEVEYEVAQNGQEALQMSAESAYDLILMDVQMPILDGYSATQQLREREAESGAGRIPIIGITAHALSGDREKCLAAGMDDYVSKPFNTAELKHKIMSLIERPAKRKSA